jgi:hypothetical protein
MVADRPFGNYSRARMAVHYGGHGGLFRDARGRWWAAFFGTAGSTDLRRHWWGPPGIVPLEVKEEKEELIVRVAEDLPPDYERLLDKKRAQIAER